ncbi:MAG TPA: AAA family ATPase, partial [Gemmatimonadota bacterium]|nr:AAA family ATPase [Gemmatimonadota bacterium]
MRILRVRVPDFGPLRSLELEPSEGLTVVWGPNEAGKTSLLDFLVGQLFRWERRTGTRLETLLSGIHRFGDPSEAGGRIEVKVRGEVLDYPGSPSLLHVLDLDHANLAGLFCVRSGELELPGAAGGEFWAELKKLLSGLPKGVDTLREAVHREALLTPGGERSDRGSPGPRTRHREAGERIGTLEALEGRLEEASRAEA